MKRHNMVIKRISVHSKNMLKEGSQSINNTYSITVKCFLDIFNIIQYFWKLHSNNKTMETRTLYNK